MSINVYFIIRKYVKELKSKIRLLKILCDFYENATLSFILNY